jgi:ureidoglycolate lyase
MPPPFHACKSPPPTGEAFAPFGSVIEASDDAVKLDINQGHAVRYDRLAEVDVADGGGRRAQSVPRPAARRAGAEAVRAPAAGQPELRAAERTALPRRGRACRRVRRRQVRLFRAEGHQGVHYRKGVWHHFLLVLEADSDFLVIDRAGPGDNCEEIALGSDDEVRMRPGP